MLKNEADTHYHLIDPVLRTKGYVDPYITLETPAPVEPTGPKGRRRKGPGKTDYLIGVHVPNGPKPLPVAILEAKAEDQDPLKGMQQAKGYSECERFEAKYIFSTNGHLYGKYNKFGEREKAARDAQSKADAIDAAVFDLKAVNRNAIVKIDARTPGELIQSIEEQGKIVAKSLATLKTLLES